MIANVLIFVLGWAALIVLCLMLLRRHPPR